MAKPWTEKEDAFMMRHWGVGVDYVARHDLGRPAGSGSIRLKKLVESGAAAEFATAMHHLSNYRLLCGRARAGFTQDVLADDAASWSSKAEMWRKPR